MAKAGRGSVTSTLHIVVACSDGKRGTPRAEHHLRRYPRGPLRATRWLAGLEKAQHLAVPAKELYVGNHWAVARGMPDLALAAGWARSRLWVVSAGYGLVAAEDGVIPYSATFGRRHADSVVDSTSKDEPFLQTRDWWSALQSERDGARSLPAILGRDPDAGVVFVGSRSYVEAARDELVRALPKLKDTSRLVIVTGQPPRDGSLSEHAVIPPARIRAQVGGPLTSLHARTAARVVRAVAPSDWSVDAASEVIKELAAVSRLEATPERTTLTDEQVRSFVRRALQSDERASASRLLRELRDGGHACEQHRFRHLFLDVRGIA